MKTRAEKRAAREQTLVRRFVRMFTCDTARIVRTGGTMFLIIGCNRNTKDDPGQWFQHRSGKLPVPVDFDYVQERVIASGRTEAALMKSAKEYKRLLGINWDIGENRLLDWLREGKTWFAKRTK